MIKNLSTRYPEAPAAAKITLVGNGNGIAVDATRVPEPHFWNKLSAPATRMRLNLLFRYALPALRASAKVMYAPRIEPAVAAVTYSYQGFRRLATSSTRRMSGPPNVGTGELSRTASENSPNAPR